MRCTIDWSLTTDAWDEIFAVAPRPSLLQSRPYGEAVTPRMGQRIRRGLARIDGAPIALIQLQEAALLGRAIHAVILDRGPVWLESIEAPLHARAVFETLASEFPARLGRRRRVIPEVTIHDAHTVFDGLALKEREAPGYQTIWVNLRPDEPRLRARLKPKWRNMLAKSEAAGLTVEWDWSRRLLSPFLAYYASDQLAKGYPGPDPATIRAMAERFADKTAIAMAWDGDLPAAGILLFLHGRSATWQTGFVTETGRRAAANQLLLWQAMLTLKDHGIQWFDLGGINAEDAIGVMRFKQGLGGTDVTLAGPFA